VGNPVYTNSLVIASADRSVIAFEGYDGPVGRYRVSDGDILVRDNTALRSFDDFAIAPNRDGTRYILLSYNGGTVLGPDMLPLGQYLGTASNPPPGAAYNPAGDTALVGHAGFMTVSVFETLAWNPIAQYHMPGYFDVTPTNPYGRGWLRAASDGSYVFVNVVGGVQYFR